MHSLPCVSQSASGMQISSETVFFITEFSECIYRSQSLILRIFPSLFTFSDYFAIFYFINKELKIINIIFYEINYYVNSSMIYFNLNLIGYHKMHILIQNFFIHY